MSRKNPATGDCELGRAAGGVQRARAHNRDRDVETIGSNPPVKTPGRGLLAVDQERGVNPHVLQIGQRRPRRPRGAKYEVLGRRSGQLLDVDERVRTIARRPQLDAVGVGGPEACPDTPPAVEVDSDGCSLDQFCSQIDATTRAGKKTCKKSDWKNDEPVMTRRDRDCAVDKGGPGRGDDSCVARL